MILSERKEEIRYMLVELRMKLESDNPAFGYYQSSNMQGVLMERINTVYAEQLHKQGIKPYSQFLLNGEEKEWIVKTCTQESYQEVILPLLDAKFTAEWIQRETHKTPQEIMSLLKYLIVKSGIHAKEADWNSYDEMNEKIIRDLR